MHSHRLLHRALATVAVVSFGTSVAFVTPASAHTEKDACRTFESYPGSPNPWIKVVAEDNAFDTNCIKAPANRNWRIYLQNNDSDPHNVSIWSEDPAVDKKAESTRARPSRARARRSTPSTPWPPGSTSSRTTR